MTATLAHVLHRYIFLAICDECAHTVELDVDGLIDNLGPDCSNLYDDGCFKIIVRRKRPAY